MNRSLNLFKHAAQSLAYEWMNVLPDEPGTHLFSLATCGFLSASLASCSFSWSTTLETANMSCSTRRLSCS
jgi:hypothetical protein